MWSTKKNKLSQIKFKTKMCLHMFSYINYLFKIANMENVKKIREMRMKIA